MIAILYSILIVLILLVPSVWRIKIPAKGQYFDDAMSADNLLPWRGLFAAVILIHHFSASFDPPYLLGIFTHVGYLFVALFFFLSGYGLAFGFNISPDYIKLKTFIPKRFFKTIIPYWLCVLFAGAFVAVFYPPLDIHYFLRSFYSFRSIVANSWYVFIILIMYAAFVLLFRIRNRKIALFAMLAFVCGLITVFLIIDWSLFARSLLAFYIGIIYCFNYGKIDAFIKKSFLLKLIACFLIFAALCAARYYFATRSNYWLDNIFAILSSSVFPVLLFSFVIKKIHIGNVVLDFSGKLSYEIYLLHGLFCYYFQPLRSNMLLFFAAVVICTIISAMIIHALSRLITAPFFKRNLPQKSE